MYTLLYLESYEKVSQTEARGKSPSIHLHNDQRFHLAEEATCLDSDFLLPPLPQKRQLAGAASGPHRGPAGGGHFAWTQARWHPGLSGRPSHVRPQVPGLASNGRRLSTGRWSVVAICRSPLMGVGHMELISCYKSHVRLSVFRVVSHPPSASERRLC